jgi:uncharacterized protein YggU (UPF0235/DUF167 family)
MYVRVSVLPGAKREYCKEVGEARYEIAVKAPAERNLANIRVREILAEKLQISGRQLRLIAGHQSQRKIYSIMSEV